MAQPTATRATSRDDHALKNHGIPEGDAPSPTSELFSSSAEHNSETDGGHAFSSPLFSNSPRSVIIDISAGVSKQNSGFSAPAAAAAAHKEQQQDSTQSASPLSSPSKADSEIRMLGINYFPPTEGSDPPSVAPSGGGRGDGNGARRSSSDEKGDAILDIHPLQLDLSSPKMTWGQHGRNGEYIEGDGDEDEDEESARRIVSNASRRAVSRSVDRKSYKHTQMSSGSAQKSSSRRLEPPKSSYFFGPPPADTAYGTEPVGQLGLHHPREILRVERDYSGGEIIQLAPTYPLELEGRITPTQFLETINAFNEILISAYSLRHGFIDNVIEIFSLQLSRFVTTTHYDREMDRLRRTMDAFNEKLYNPVGLNILWPQRVGFLFLEIEYY